jgi:exodeoxyribonuclease VII large subunit
MTTMAQTEIITVSTYLDHINSTLKNQKAKILGELVNLQMYEGRSYLYFSIKDSKDQSTVKCFMWKNDFKLSGVQLRDGLEIIVTAYPAIYKPNGGLSLQVDSVELVGEGTLQLAYEQLKKKLDAEGLFAPERKRALPDYPHRIGVITSKSGAVINDFLTNIGKFGYEIVFVDSKVEGADATKDLLAAIATLRGKHIDVLVMMRGGGSLESFLAFNNETLVRAVADFPVPVLTGIGHDKDVSLVALVSDLNVSTPTAVAHALNSSWSQALSAVRLSEQKILSEYESRIKDVRYQIENSYVSIEGRFAMVLTRFAQAKQTLSVGVGRIESQIIRHADAIALQAREMIRGYEVLSRRVSDTLTQTAKTLELSNPERQLSHGYSIVKLGDKVVRSKKDVRSGEVLDILVSDGIIQTNVK